MQPAISLLLCLGLASASKVSITEFSVPKTAKVGDSVELQCRYSLQEPENALFYVKWWYTPLDGGDKHPPLYQRLGHHAPQTSHEGLRIQANDTIMLENVQPKDTGTYECEVSNNDEARQSQKLIVFTSGSGPLLNWTTVEDGEDTDVKITCSAYDVAPEPELGITVNGKEVHVDEVIQTEPIDGLYSVNISSTLEEIASPSDIRCELFFKNNDVNHEPYIATEIYEGSGAELTTTEALEDSTQWETTTTTPDGNDSILLRSSWLLSVGIAALVQLLAWH